MSHDFASLGLAEPLLRALDSARYTTPTPIQSAAIPPLLTGRDLLGIAQTGTGKTASFALPLLHRLHTVRMATRPQSAHALILAPTRELALQIVDSLRMFAEPRLRIVAVIGGQGRFGQVQRLRPGADIVVGTPGRVRDLMGTNELRLDAVRHFVLDEADRMLDLGFIRDITHIASALPEDRQSALFSATMPAEVEKLTRSMLRDPIRVAVTPTEAVVPRIAQSVHFVPQAARAQLLAELLDDRALSRVIVFTRTKRGADRVADALTDAGHGVVALHGNKSQPQRLKALDRFRDGRARVLVATDIAARGIDVQAVTHVINYDLPAQPEDYVHRIGRTARAGANGAAISFCDPQEAKMFRAIERAAGAAIAIASGTPAARPAEAMPQFVRPTGPSRRKFRRRAA
ncbi:MAG: DEAD/DEAH box helicase [Rhodospirillales bacterium]|nr:DEAD/DEAH box helicase [Rhodospirillales bacterium]